MSVITVSNLTKVMAKTEGFLDPEFLKYKG